MRDLLHQRIGFSHHDNANSISSILCVYVGFFCLGEGMEGSSSGLSSQENEAHQEEPLPEIEAGKQFFSLLLH